MNICNYNHLFYFFVTAKIGGVTAAAKHLNTSQSSLSAQIKTLESSLGKKLFKKVGRSIELTETGREMFFYCRRAFESFDEMLTLLKNEKSSLGPKISLGVSSDIERPFITDALSEVSKKYRGKQRLALSLMSLPSPILMQQLKAGELDLVLTTEGKLDDSMQVVKELEYPVGIYSIRGLAHLPKNKLAFVLPSKITSLRSEIDEYFVKARIRPLCVFESNIMSSVVRAASDGLGATILPSAYLAREVRLKRLVQLNLRPLWKHRLILVAIHNNLEGLRKELATDLAAQLQTLQATA